MVLKGGIMLRVLALLYIIAVTIGCAHPEHRHDVDVHRINCSGIMQSITDCYADAYDICGEGGYLIISQTGRGALHVGRGRFVMSAQEVRMMTIRCTRGLSAEEIRSIREASSQRNAGGEE